MLRVKLPLFEAAVVAEAEAEDDDGLLLDDCNKKGAFIVIESANARAAVLGHFYDDSYKASSAIKNQNGTCLVWVDSDSWESIIGSFFTILVKNREENQFFCYSKLILNRS